MARIRSIKPEFWSDDKIAQLSHGCTAFFIGFWNFCDDEGKCEDNPHQLALRMPIFRREDISRWTKTLVAHGLLQRGSLVATEWLTSGSPVAWLRVTNWSHQKIDRPRVAKIKSEEIQWLETTSSTIDREASSNVRRKDRIGAETNGSDRIYTTPRTVVETPAPKKASPPAPSAAGVNAKDFIARYCELFKTRYGDNPPITGQDAGIVTRLLKNVAKVEMLRYLEAYFEMPDAYLHKARHPLTLFETKLKEVAVYAASGSFITARQAHQGDDLAANMQLLRKIQQEGV